MQDTSVQLIARENESNQKKKKPVALKELKPNNNDVLQSIFDKIPTEVTDPILMQLDLETVPIAQAMACFADGPPDTRWYLNTKVREPY
jgi:hypothetical protein